jgi:signal transduction histidine kinase/CheY-like chemotaxis protein/purine-cytosine permease-like protein
VNLTASERDAIAAPVQRVVRVRRDYNTWVATETLEDYALRFTPRSWRKWSEFRVANTAFGTASFLVLEAIGATLLVKYGFVNAAVAVLAAGLIIFLTALPVSIYAARHGLDMDLLTRGAGFGYLGSTLTSLIYASFTFILFALEAAIMAYALELAFGIPPAWGYLICALVVIPLVTHGITVIGKLQTLTQPLWLALLILPFVFLFIERPDAVRGLTLYAGVQGTSGAAELHLIGAGMAVVLALTTQTGEQVDYLRFMPAFTASRRGRWLTGVLVGGPGWVIPGVLKMLGGMLLAFLVLESGHTLTEAVDPNRMYLVAYGHAFDSVGLVIAVTAVFVILSQIKINVTNAYAGSLAWSNFFARLTHSHPGRVVWVVFNTLIALMLMELGLFHALEQVLALYSTVAVAWMMTVVADLVINKPLGLSPAGIEFRRAYLYDINPVGIGAMGLASVLSVSAHLGLFGPTIQPYAIFIAILVALTASPAIAWLTGGRYYLARPLDAPLTGSPVRSCGICGKTYEAEDMAHCPAYQDDICSLCCTLDARCHDHCKPHARLTAQWNGLLARLLPARLRPYLDAGLGHYLLLMLGITAGLGLLMGLLSFQIEQGLDGAAPALLTQFQHALLYVFATLLLVAAVVAWWLVLTHKSRQVAQEESLRQTQLLMQEIESHRRTDALLQKAKAAAEQANQAKSRHISALSHELRTPLNSILGYAQILDADPTIPPHRRQAVAVIRRSGEHLLSLIEGTLDIARIEAGKLTLEMRPLDFPACMRQVAAMIEQQARQKGLDFHYVQEGDLPAWVRTDERRLRQILLNILGNAVKFTLRGSVTLRVRYQREMGWFTAEDTGPGIDTHELQRIFEPFVRGSAAQLGATGGTGLGLTIARMLTELMGGELSVESRPGLGSRFQVRLYLPSVSAGQATALGERKRVGYTGRRRRVLVVDNESVDRELLVNVLAPLGFEVAQAESGQSCLDLIPMLHPDAILMDLAMPGMDGWETLRRIRSLGQGRAALAILSANAFEKGAENEVGITPADFFTKPLQVDALLDWLGQRLGLEWIEEAATPAAQPLHDLPQPRILAPAQEHVEALRELIDQGYVRGILSKLDEIERIDPMHHAFVEALRTLAGRFQFDAMQTFLDRHSRDSD